MTEQVIETIRQIVERLNARDAVGSFPLIDPELDWISTFASIEGGSYHGHAGWARYLRDLDEQWTGFRIVADDFLLVGRETVILVARAQARGHASGVSVDTPIWTVTRLRAGRLLWARTFLSAAEAEREALSTGDAAAADGSRGEGRAPV